MRPIILHCLVLFLLAPSAVKADDVPAVNATGNTASDAIVKQRELDEQLLRGRWRIVEGHIPDDWWGYRGVLDSVAIGDRLDLTFEASTAKQYRSEVDWHLVGQQQQPTIEFTLDDATTQLAAYQIENDLLVVVFRSKQQGNHGPAKFARVVDVKSATPVPEGFREFTIPNGLRSEHVDRVTVGSVVDVLVEVEVNTGTDAPGAQTCGGILASSVVIHAISGPGSQPNRLNVTVLIPEATLDTWNNAAVFTNRHLYPGVSVVLQGTYPHAPTITFPELSELIAAQTSLGIVMGGGSTNPGARLALMTEAIETSPKWAKPHLEQEYAAYLTYYRSQAETQPGLTAQDDQSTHKELRHRDSYAARETAEETYRTAEEASQQAAREYRAEAAQESPDAQALAELEQKLNSAVKTAFETQMKQQQIRLQTAQLDLAEALAKHQRRESLASKIIERRVADLINGEDLEWPQTQLAESQNTVSPLPDVGGETKAGSIAPTNEGKTPLPIFATPQDLVDYMEHVGGNKGTADFAQFVSLLTDDEVKRFSGLMLRTASMLQSVAGLMTTFGTEGAGNDGAEILSMTSSLALIIEKSKLINPTPAAQAAFQQISAGVNVLQLFQANQPQLAVDADTYSELLRTAAGVLKDPHRFLVEVMSTMAEIAPANGSAAEPKKPADWQITVNGNTATAVNRTTTSTNAIALEMPQEMTLTKVGDTWKISSLISENMIIEMQQGIKVSESTSQGDSTSPAPVVMAPAASPARVTDTEVRPYGVNSANAGRDIRPYSELNEKNVGVGTVLTEDLTKSTLSPADIKGKYVSRRVKQGELITADMLIDKPTTEQIVGFWLREAEASGDVFETMSSQLSTGPNNAHYAIDRPFSASYAKRFNENLPEWADEYLRTLTKQLSATTPENWSTQQQMLIRSVEELIHNRQSNSSHDLAELGELLSRFVILNSKKETIQADSSMRKFSHSLVVLGELARLTGSFPEQVLDSAPDDAETAAKLALLKQMAENGADLRWIRQEHLRLVGLLEEAPVQALKLLLTSAPIKSSDNLSQWIVAMSSIETDRAVEAYVVEPSSPSVDPVILIAVAELIAGKEQQMDDNLALIFEQPSNGNNGEMFYRHASDLLESDLAYRHLVLKSLVRIYQKSKSENLKQNIAKLAPAVPVMAKQDASSTASPATPE